MKKLMNAENGEEEKEEDHCCHSHESETDIYPSDDE